MTNAEMLAQIQHLDRIAFGSCNKQYEKQVLWKGLIEQSADLFIWGGDSIYADTTNPDKILAAYNSQNQVQDYKLFKAQTPIIGTWDDHDFGNNNEDGRYPHKKISQKYALDFLEETENSPRRKREGIYTSYTFGELGKKIKIILLDNRYFRKLDSTFPLLGQEQWRWLETQIIESDANLHLIVSGLSVISPQNPHGEEWADYALEKSRLSAFLKAKKVPYLYLTGDKHFASIFRRDNELEFLSSGMTHNTRIPLRPYVRTLYPAPVFINNYGLIDISWEEQTPLLTLTIRSSSDQSIQMKKVKWEGDSWKDI